MRQALVVGSTKQLSCRREGRATEELKSFRVAGRCKRKQKGGIGTALKTNNAIQHKPGSGQLLSSLEEGILFVDPNSLPVQLRFRALFS